MIEIKTRFITPEEFTQYKGIDLKLVLNDHNAERFIMNVEDDLDNFLTTRIGKDMGWIYKHYKLTDEQKLLFKKAVIEQVYYVFRNGDIRSDSGYDPDFGKRADQKYLNSIAVGPKAVGYLQKAGIWTLHIGGSFTFPFGILGR